MGSDGKREERKHTIRPSFVQITLVLRRVLLEQMSPSLLPVFVVIQRLALSMHHPDFFYVYLPRLFDSKKRWRVHNMNDDAYYQKLKGYYTVKCYFLSRRFESDGEDQGGENSQQTCTGSQR